MAAVFLRVYVLLLALQSLRVAMATTTTTTTTTTELHLLDTTTSQGVPNSIVSALLDSSRSGLLELLEQAGLLQELESAIAKRNLTIFAPGADFFDKHFDSGFKTFLLQPANAEHLRRVLLSHVLPRKILSSQWQDSIAPALSGEGIHLHWSSSKNLAIDDIAIDSPDLIVKPDGVVHGINKLLVPKRVQDDYAAARMKHLPPAVRPIGAPELIIENAAAIRQEQGDFNPDFNLSTSNPSTHIHQGETFAPAPAPSSSPFSNDGQARVDDFISALLDYGGYGEFAQLLVNLTSFASELAKLVDEGHWLTILAPNDAAIDKLSTEQLNSPGGIDAILSYHVISEYHTEESLYTLSTRHHKLEFSTLRPPFKIYARESEGTVQFHSTPTTWLSSSSFSSSSSPCLLLDANIYADGRLSVQGINAVLIPWNLVPVGRRNPRRLMVKRGEQEHEQEQEQERAGTRTATASWSAQSSRKSSWRTRWLPLLA